MKEYPVWVAAKEFDEKPWSWKKYSAYGWPPGSVRALLAVAVFGGICWWLAKKPSQAVPNYLSNLLFVIMGHYFASRAAPQNVMPDESRHVPPPLWLPKGSVRTVLVAMFLATACWLFYHRQIVDAKHLTQSGVTLILVAGFLVGVLRAHLFTKTNRFLEDLRATAAVVATALMLALTFGGYKIESDAIKDLLVQFRTEDVLAAVVGFYFGSKS